MRTKTPVLMLLIVVILGSAASTQALPPKKHHWKLEETEGTTVYDSLGSRNGTNSGATINQAGSGDPDFKAYYFNGGDNIVNLGSGWIPASDDFAVSLRFKTDDPQGHSCNQGHLFSWNDGSNNYRGAIYIDNGSLGLWMRNGPMISYGPVADGNWHTVELVREGSTWTLTVDGSSSSTDKDVAFPQNINVTIGKGDTGSGGCYGYKGLVSDVVYREGSAADDIDGDDIHNDVDNCPYGANPDQADSDQNGVGDACEGDADSDGVPDDEDNCPNVPNPEQTDEDGNGIGDDCEPVVLTALEWGTDIVAAKANSQHGGTWGPENTS